MLFKTSALRGKKVLIIILSIFVIFSCSWEETKKESVIKESWEIIEWYVDTLEWSVQDARAVKELMEQNQQKLKDNLNVY